jgi:hypothetical protein
MSRKLELVREEKLFRLLPGRKESSRLEASGIALVDDTTALVVFDNLNQVARINLSLKRRASNRLLCPRRAWDRVSRTSPSTTGMAARSA